MKVYDEDDPDEELDEEAPPERDVLGPDERDADLMDGTWEQQYYARRPAERDWRGISVGIAVLLLAALVLPLILAVRP